MGTPLTGCTVIFSDGRTATDKTVRIREDSFVRVGNREDGYTYYPPHAIKAVSFDPEDSDA